MHTGKRGKKMKPLPSDTSGQEKCFKTNIYFIPPVSDINNNQCKKWNTDKYDNLTITKYLHNVQEKKDDQP